MIKKYFFFEFLKYFIKTILQENVLHKFCDTEYMNIRMQDNVLFNINSQKTISTMKIILYIIILNKMFIQKVLNPNKFIKRNFRNGEYVQYVYECNQIFKSYIKLLW